MRAYHGAVNGLRRLARGPRIKGVPMGRGIVVSSVCALLVLQFQIPVSTQAGAGVVQVTPLGSHAGELCFADRAIVFEDPKGVRILYDPGRTVDESDPRLGTIDVVLLSHVAETGTGCETQGRPGLYGRGDGPGVTFHAPPDEVRPRLPPRLVLG